MWRPLESHAQVRGYLDANDEGNACLSLQAFASVGVCACSVRGRDMESCRVIAWAQLWCAVVGCSTGTTACVCGSWWPQPLESKSGFQRRCLAQGKRLAKAVLALDH